MNANGSGYRVALGGLGAIGLKVARALDDGIPGLTLTAVSANNREAAAERMADFKTPPPVVGLGDLAALADVVIECAPAAVFDDIAESAIEAGKIFMPLSCAALLSRPHLEKRAAETGARIIVPTGALVGFDAVSNLTEPLQIFKGSARDAAVGFPANVNVAAALSMAGIGPDETTIEIWADPDQPRNKHTITVDATSTRFTMVIEGIPTPNNPATGLLTPLSVIATLRGLTSTLRVGT
jgi:aspartate dehydrogenase